MNAQQGYLKSFWKSCPAPSTVFSSTSWLPPRKTPPVAQTSRKKLPRQGRCPHFESYLFIQHLLNRCCRAPPVRSGTTSCREAEVCRVTAGMTSEMPQLSHSLPRFSHIFYFLWTSGASTYLCSQQEFLYLVLKSPDEQIKALSRVVGRAAGQCLACESRERRWG